LIGVTPLLHKLEDMYRTHSAKKIFSYGHWTVVILSKEDSGQYLKMRVVQLLPEDQLADNSSSALQTFILLLEILKKAALV
jgi:hypothetical protein